jgi:hypothetical protein
MTDIAQAGERKRYCSLYRIGYWCSLDAECETRPIDDGVIRRHVEFRLINRFGESCDMGLAIFTELPDGERRDDGCRVYNEDGQYFPYLEGAVRVHAESLVLIHAMPGRWVDQPARYETWQGTEATAFDRVTE